MELEKYPGCHLTYCTNVHPGESWQEVWIQLKENLPELKRRLSPGKPFGIGLRLSADAAVELLESDKLNRFKEWLTQEGLYVFTLNGFPYGSFHRQRVKDRVYMPDWRTDERVEYTSNLIAILAELLPENLDGGISTSPLSYKYWLDEQAEKQEVFRISSKNFAHLALEMANIQNDRGCELHLDIEPEPDCLIENSRETIDYFLNWLLPVGSEYLLEEFGIPEEKAIDILLNHIRLCYDTCHFAVEYEDPVQAIENLSEAGIRIGKTQISAALKVALGRLDTGSSSDEW
ncbi:MAG: metabolite traffic protein EboE [Balneolaceae bacterium]